MIPNIKPTQAAKNAAKFALDPFETLGSQVGKPMMDEAAKEIGSFFGSPLGMGARPQTLAAEDLQRARDEQRLKELEEQDNAASKESAQRIQIAIKQEYKTHEAKSQNSQRELQRELAELQAEAAKLAKAAGLETKAHLQNSAKKLGILDIKIITSVIRVLRIKAEESKSAKELVSQRQNTKRTTGMLAWVSGKQMKVHEQGTLQLQG